MRMMRDAVYALAVCLALMAGLSSVILGLSEPAHAFRAGGITSGTQSYSGGVTFTPSINKTTTGGQPWTLSTVSSALNSTGGVTSAMLSPNAMGTAAAAFKARFFIVNCNLTAGGVTICPNQGTMTFTFNQPVTNPTFHVDDMGAGLQIPGASVLSPYNVFFDVASFVGTGATPTTQLMAGSTTMGASGSRIGNASGSYTPCNIGAQSSQCGSVRLNGTFSSITFNVSFAVQASNSYTGYTATSVEVEEVNFTVTLDEDLGDAPTAYQGNPVATHFLTGYRIGSGITPENTNTLTSAALTTSSIASTTASGDTDDGVTLPAGLTRGQTVLIPVAVTGSGGLLQAWIDWGRNSNFTDAIDKVATNAVDGGAGDADGTANGVVTLSVPVPAGASLGTSFARFRYSTVSNLDYFGAAPNGEVEDYQVSIIDPTADLAVTKTNSSTSVVAGSTTTYTVRVTNNGPSSVTGAKLVDAVATGLSKTAVACSAAASNQCSTAPSIATLEAGTVSLPALASGAFYEVTVTANVTATSGSVTNSATATVPAGTTDPDTTNNTGSDTDTVTPGADLVVTKTNGVSTVNAGGTTTYTVRVTNNGPSSVTGATLVDAAATGLSKTAVACSAAASNKCSTAPSIAALEAGTVSLPAITSGAFYEVTVTANVTATSGSVTNAATATVPSGTTDPDTTNNTGSDTDTVTPIADLVVTKTDGRTSVINGTRSIYTITVTNNGPSAITGALLTDPATAGISVYGVTCSATPGQCGSSTIPSVAALQAGYALPALASGQTFSIDVLTDIMASTSTVTNAVTVAAPVGVTDPNTNNNTASDTDTVTTNPSAPIPQQTTLAACLAPSMSTTPVNFASLDNSGGAFTQNTAGQTVVAGSVSAAVQNGVTVFQNGAGVIRYDDPAPHLSSAYFSHVVSFARRTPVRLASGALFGLANSNMDLRADRLVIEAVGPSAGFAWTISGSNAAATITNSGTTITIEGNDSGSRPGSFANFDLGTSGTLTGVRLSYQTRFDSGNSNSTQVSLFTPSCGVDRGDAPATYGEADHIAVPELLLGSLIDAEATSIASAQADGDGSDDDGVSLPVLTRGLTATIPVAIQQPAANAGYLQAWFDWNGDGDFADAGEQVASNVQYAAGTSGTIQLSVSVPADASLSPSFARFRWSSTAGLSASGSASDGEAEDYAFTLANVSDLVVTKTNGVSVVDAGGATTYTVRVTNNGPSSVTGATLSDPAITGLSKTAVACTAAASNQCSAPPSVAQLEGTSFALPALAPAAFYEVTVTANVTATSGSVTNSATATVPAGTTDPTPGNNTGSDTDTVTPIADFVVTKTNGVSAVNVGGTTAYTVRVTNNGPSSVTGATLVDAAAAGLSKTTVACSAAASNQCSTPPSIANLEAGTVSLPALASGAFYEVTVTANVMATSGSVTNSATATVPSGTTDPTPGNNTGSDTDTVNSIDAVNDDFRSTPFSVSGGTTPSVFTNDLLNGASFGSGAVTATITDAGGLAGVDATEDNYVWIVMNPDGTITLPDKMSSGTYTVTYQICSAAAPTLCDTATVLIAIAQPAVTGSFQCTGTNLLTNGGFETPAIVSPNATYAFFADSDVPGFTTTDIYEEFELWQNGYRGAGAHTGNQFAEMNASSSSVVTASINVHPRAQVDFYWAHAARVGTDVGNLVLTDNQGGSFNYGNFSATRGSGWVTHGTSYLAGPTVTALDANFTAVSTGYGGDDTLGNFLDTIEACQTYITLTKSETARVDADGSGGDSVGDRITYTYTFSNPAGNAHALAPTTIVDDKIGTFSAATPASGDSNSNNLLDVGETWTVTKDYTLTAADFVAGSVTNVAYVNANTGTNVIRSDDATVTAALTPSADLVVNKSNGANGVTSGTSTTYTITVTNNGPSAATGAVVTDTVGGGLNCPAANPVNISGSGVPSGSFTVGSLTGAGIALGNLAAGQSAILSFNCTIP